MKQATKIVLINAAIAVVIALMSFMSESHVQSSEFFVWLGLSCLGIGLLDLVIAVILFIAGPTNYNAGKGFLLSSGILILTGFAVCGGSLGIMH